MPRRGFTVCRSVLFRTAALAVGSALFLTGCQGGAAPGGLPSETGTTTASPTAGVSLPPVAATPGNPGDPSPSAAYKPADAKGKAQNVPVPVMPELAKENSKAGLEAFIRYWYAVGNYADETGDVSGLVPLSTPECKACIQFQNAALDGSRDGRWIVGGKVRTPRIEVSWNSGKTTHQVKAQVIQEAITYYSADGTEGRPADPATNDAFVMVASFDSKWKVVDTGVLR
ncbi:hypothetical protein J2Y66_001200 [Paenarthrobacter nitroguajacolicus]|uniref:DUF6318 family protein n=1 Tax=Paenarthrobacter nitroguajacolicus TaxID=211146 RepID=UPI00285990D4|nr:DUF6318 family protein [Paenarthrobacter nitroguajacolicus]MDR6986730.1 hypothetical protein [Paenarthrobacter nitroguajacolicus]